MIEWRRVWAVIRKDWLEIARDKQVIAPLVIIPLLFSAVIPSAVLLLGNTGAPTSAVGGMQSFVDNLPPGIVSAGFSVEQTIAYAIIVYFMAPFFLLIPVMIGSITASSSLVGEKERRTIEGLLYSPLSNRELVLAKVLGSVVPAVVLTWIAFLLYTVIVTVLGAPMMGGLFFPTATWLVVVIALVPLVAFLATSLIVAVSARSTTMQGAQGTAMFVVFPILAIIIGQSTGLMLFDVTVALVTAGALLVVDAAAFVLVVARFDRERIVTRL